MFTTILLSLLVLGPATVFAQNLTFLTGLESALASAGLAQTNELVQSLNGTATGASLLANISNGDPHLIFAPTDAACKYLSSFVSLDSQ